ncbi:protein Spt23p [[Candida] anglica]
MSSSFMPHQEHLDPLEQPMDLDFHMNGQDLLDEFLDQRVYETPPGQQPPNTIPSKQGDIPAHNNSNPENVKMEPFDVRLDDTNYNIDTLDSLDIGSFYQNSPEGFDYSNNQTTFHSPEGVSPAIHNEIEQKSGQPSLIPIPTGVESTQLNSSNYDYIRTELAKLKFGNPNMDPRPASVEVPDASYLDFSPEAMAKLPYKLELSSLPAYSRVETQIKLNFSLSPPPPSYLLHIPQDLISKSKFCLKNSIDTLSPEFKDNILFLDTYVFTSDLQKSCSICSRCIKREQKRASRRKSGMYGDNENGEADAAAAAAASVSAGTSSQQVTDDSSPKNNTSWSDENMSKRAIIFNCKEIVSFPPPNGLNNDMSSLELSARIVCYCRHHKEPKGFKLLFVIKNNRGEVLAKNVSSPIMIMDRKKTVNNKSSNMLKESSQQIQDSQPSLSSIKQEDNNSPHMHPLSPNSIDDSNSTNTDTANEEHRSLKRKKYSVDDSYNNSMNPMFNGSSNNFSPISNSDTNTNTSTHNYFVKPAVANPFGIQQPITQPQGIRPSIQRIIPAEGPIRGGIAVTLLGFNFRPGLRVKFGPHLALATHCWSETTIVTYLPPASQPGQVLVTCEGESMVIGDQESQVFTYTDDTDRQLIELALQIVGLKMNGKLEDAKNIAKRIVGTGEDRSGSGSGASSNNMANGPVNGSVSHVDSNEANKWFDNAHRAVQQLTKSDLSTEDILINFLSLVDLPNCPITLLNWSLCNAQGQSLLHLATLKNYSNLIRFLITHGCKIDVKDNQGLTPLFFAALCGQRELINIYLGCKSNYNLKLSNDLHLTDYCDLNVLDIFSELSEGEDFGSVFASKDKLNKSLSVDSLNSMFTMNYGKHISKMVIEENSEISTSKKLESGDRHVMRSEFKPSDTSDVYDESNYSSEFADSEGESDDYDDDGLESEVDNENVEQSQLPVNNSLWQRVKNVFNHDDEDMELPSYDDLFPFGHSSKPEIIETTASSSGSNTSNSKLASVEQEDSGVTSDSSDDLIISYQIKTGRKTVKNDKMLLFFWFPALITIAALFFSVSVMGYKFEFIESIKDYVRQVVGNLMVGNERVVRVFQKENNGFSNFISVT